VVIRSVILMGELRGSSNNEVTEPPLSYCHLPELITACTVWLGW